MTTDTNTATDAPVELTNMSDVDITALTGKALRRFARKNLDDWSQRTTVLRMEMTPGMPHGVGTNVAFAALVKAMRKTYKGRGPRVEERWQTVELTVWHDDEALRRSLIYKRDRLITARDESPES